MEKSIKFLGICLVISALLIGGTLVLTKALTPVPTQERYYSYIQEGGGYETVLYTFDKTTGIYYCVSVDIDKFSGDITLDRYKTINPRNHL